MYGHNYIDDQQYITKYGQPMKAQEICNDLQSLWRENRRLEQQVAEQLAESERLTSEQARLNQQLQDAQQQLLGLSQQAITLLQGIRLPVMREGV
ncbi:hypothetical protein C4K68_13930 [Pokkaliibacter plantistimulans]|uniref:Uncharacterized protein n=1 Tax=Proteobacteria bacterium 228 TaxID=2083153 RepID=A0A2S5KPI4_9PROT|nr:hypothetical protein [Pokkaliibacter plantistimulans]PPC76757.1 hypothetical protein C4K68_13930 [Pokkaliibacter plantistimulans]